MPVLVTLARERGDVVIDLGLEGNRQHSARALQDDLIKPDTHLRAGIVTCYYSQHWRSFLPAFHRRSSSFGFNEEGTPRPRTGGRSTGSGHISPDLVDRTLALLDDVSPGSIVELGMFQGGSAALMHEEDPLDFLRTRTPRQSLGTHRKKKTP